MIWETTYQGNPTPPAGTVFMRAWWASPAARFDVAAPNVGAYPLGRARSEAEREGPVGYSAGLGGGVTLCYFCKNNTRDKRHQPQLAAPKFSQTIKMIMRVTAA